MLYHGKWPNRFDSTTTLDDLQEIKQISTEDRGPKIDITWSAAYIKTPGLLAYICGNLEQQIAREVEACEILRKSPRPNTATYHGYQDTRGRASGLYFKLFTASLLKMVDPQRLPRVAFRSSGRELVNWNVKSGLQGLLAGIKHLHSLGLVHNDSSTWLTDLVDADFLFV